MRRQPSSESHPARRALRTVAGAGLAGLIAGAAGAAEFAVKPPLPAGTKVEKLEFSLWLPTAEAPATSAIVIMSRGRGAKVYANQGWRDLATRLGAGLILAKIRVAGDDVEVVAGGGGDALLAGIAALGEAAKRPGLAQAPLVLWGHSRGGYFVNDVARWKPGRVIAFVSHHEGTLPAPVVTTPTAESVTVPGVYTVGEKDLDIVRKHAPAQFARDRSVGALRCLLIEPGANHTDVLRTDSFVLPWIAVVHARRMPAGSDPAQGPVALRPIDAASGRAADPADAAASSWLPDEATLALWRSAGGAK